MSNSDTYYQVDMVRRNHKNTLIKLCNDDRRKYYTYITFIVIFLLIFITCAFCSKNKVENPAQTSSDNYLKQSIYLRNLFNDYRSAFFYATDFSIDSPNYTSTYLHLLSPILCWWEFMTQHYYGLLCPTQHRYISVLYLKT